MSDQLGSYTIRSHGMILARLHMYDWIILLLLAVIDGLLNIIEPFHRFVGKDMMTDLRYPMKGNTVPFWAVPVCSALVLHILISNIDLTVCYTQYVLRHVIFSFITADCDRATLGYLCCHLLQKEKCL